MGEVFQSLHRWNRTPLEFLESDECPMYDPKTTVASMDIGGVAVGVLSTWYGPHGDLISNEDALSLCRQYPSRFRALASCDIRKPAEGLAELSKYLSLPEKFFVGVRILPWLWEKYATDRLFYPIFAECCRLDVPLCLQVGQTGPLRPSDVGRPIPYLEQVLLDFPSLKVVAGHIGSPWTDEMLFLCRKFPNLYIDTSAYTPERYPPELVEFMRSKQGRTRVLYGSNFPMIHHKKIFDQLGRLNLDQETQRLFLRANAERVFMLGASVLATAAKL